MDVKKVGKNISEAIQKNISIGFRPLKNRLSLQSSFKQNRESNIEDIITNKALRIDQDYQRLRQNTSMDYKARVKIVSCLKLAQYTWKQYLSITNKNGQIAAQYLKKFQKINVKYSSAIQQLLVSGSLEKVQESKNFLKSLINILQQKSRKYYEHQNKFKTLTKSIEDNKKDHFEHEEQVKEQMVDLVEKFKIYAINIQQNLTKDSSVIDQIGKSQDSVEDSLKKKSDTMKDIINEQKIGFFKLIIMGIIAGLMWLFGLIVIIIT